MIRVLALGTLFACLSGVALAQGVAQTPSGATINQQRQNGSTVSPGIALPTNPQSNAFRSPIASPFGTSGASNLPAKGGYAGNGVNR